MTTSTPETAQKNRVDEALDELICPLCMGTFEQPRSLNCLHSYCEGCLVGLQRATGSKSQVLACPECRAATQLTTAGVKDLPINFKLKRFVEILTTEERQKITRKGSLLAMNSSRRSSLELICPIHRDKSLEYFCGPCKAVICGKCMIEEHRIHGEVKYASEVLEEHVIELKKIIPCIEEVVSDGEVMLTGLKAGSKELDKSVTNGLSEVRSYFSNIREILYHKEEGIIAEMKSQAKRKEKLSRKHVTAMTQALEEVEDSKQLLEDAVDRKPYDISLLLEEKQLRIRVQAGMRLVEEQIIDSKATQALFTNLIPFVPEPSLESLCQALCYSTESTIESRRYTSSVSKDKNFSYRIHNNSENAKTSPARVGFSQRPFSSSEVPSSDNSSLFSVIRSSTVVSTKVSENSAEILKPVSEIETKNLIGPYTKVTAYPHAVCCLVEGTLLVTDSRHHLFRIITSTGKCIQTIGSEGKGDGQFNEPMGIALDREGNILMLDGKGAGRMQKFSMAGKFLSKFKVRGLTSGPYMAEPVGVAVLRNGDVLVTDGGKNCVHIFEASGKYQGKFGNITDLKHPAGIAASTTRVVIADKAIHCIFILTQHGQLLTRVGKQGTLPGEFLVPYGVAIHKDGHIAVSECGNHRISLFTPGGKFIRCFGTKGSESGKFKVPRQLCFNHQNFLVVCDEQNQRLQLFNVEFE